MELYILLFTIPVVAWVLIAKLCLGISFSWPEAALQATVTSAVICFVFFAGSHHQTSDVKFVNGVVKKLEPRNRSCPGGWSSYKDSHCTEYRTRTVKISEICSSNSNGITTCTPVYDTEYKYTYGWERRFFVHADYSAPYKDTVYEIARVDAQGNNTPPRFSDTKIGSPVTKQVSYTNYIKAASSSLFSEKEPGDSVVLAYPRVSQGWLANRVIVSGVKVNADTWKQWNKDMMHLNSGLRDTGANAIVVLTSSGPEFSEMLARAWHAHNINDVVTVIGLQDKKIDWIDVTSWSDNSLVNIGIRDRIMDLEKFDMSQISTIIQEEVASNFDLKDMTDFEYLADDITPPTWIYVLAFLILLVITPMTTFVLHKTKFIG